jgi:aminoglycoside phosphotransferase (APT) family kinase protein
VLRFPSARVLLVASPGLGSGPRDEAAIASLLAEAGVPAARVRSGPAAIQGWSVTAWTEVRAADPPVAADAAMLGGLARRLHDATGMLDPRGLIAADPVGAALAQLEEASVVGATTEAELGVLQREATRLELVWQAAVDEARASSDDEVGGGAVVHGDLHVDNVLVGERGPVLLDLELAGWGPRAYDAAPTVTFVRWFDRPETDLVAFDGEYGAPLTDAASRRGLDDVWRLWSACWAVANRHRSEAAADEAEVRVTTLATGEAPRAWRLR